MESSNFVFLDIEYEDDEYVQQSCNGFACSWWRRGEKDATWEQTDCISNPIEGYPTLKLKTYERIYEPREQTDVIPPTSIPYQRSLLMLELTIELQCLVDHEYYSILINMMDRMLNKQYPHWLSVKHLASLVKDDEDSSEEVEDSTISSTTTRTMTTTTTSLITQSESISSSSLTTLKTITKTDAKDIITQTTTTTTTIKTAVTPTETTSTVKNDVKSCFTCNPGWFALCLVLFVKFHFLLEIQ